MRNILATVAVVLALAVAAHAAARYVDAASGDDSNDGLSVESSWKTLEKANAALRPGDTVFVRAGVYKGEWICPARSGAPEARITYAAYEGETPEVTGGKSGSVCMLSNKSYITVKGLKLSSPDEHDWTVALSGESCRYNRIEKCEVTDPKGYVCITINDGASYNEVIGCRVHDTGGGNEQSGDGIVMNTGAHHNTITGNTVYNCCHSQIMALRGSHHNVIAENEMYSTDKAWAGAGVNLPRGADHNEIARNRIHDLGYITDQKCAIQIDSADNNIHHNVIWNVGAFGIAIQSYKFGEVAQNAERNLITNNTVVNTVRQGLYVNCKHGCISRDNRIAGNIFTGSPRDWYGANAWLMILDTYHHTEEIEPGEWFGNVFENNTFWHERAGEPDMVLYNYKTGAKTWSIPELEKAYPDSFRNNREVKPAFTAPEKADFSLKAE